jgi:hypothetical protein
LLLVQDDVSDRREIVLVAGVLAACSRLQVQYAGGREPVLIVNV